MVQLCPQEELALLKATFEESLFFLWTELALLEGSFESSFSLKPQLTWAQFADHISCTNEWMCKGKVGIKPFCHYCWFVCFLLAAPGGANDSECDESSVILKHSNRTGV